MFENWRGVAVLDFAAGHTREDGDTCGGGVVRLPIAELLTMRSPRSAGEDPEHVRRLADSLTELPPIVVHRDTLRVVDGRHRLRAAILRGQDDIAARLFDGDEIEAFLFSVRANTTHGLPLSTADRKTAAARIVTARPQWSDRLVASVVGLAPATVAEVRRRQSGPQPVARIGRDGRIRPVDAAARRRAARELMVAQPQLSLRQVAHRAGISPETARAVRASLATPEPRPDSDTAALMRALRSDPSLRFSESGRMLLRLLDAGAMSHERWAAIGQSVPPHCRDAIARAAMEASRGWRRFAERLAQES
ncbi:ParB/RepB/Spo0J family partition protein [Actinokineospora sp. UTMC 2448]|uniref:ParB/RepB/Spo0J family partition protein n=1 Tax=Actinokineospora sp. UTMC 2448 TaxID=2268449 RepID=UPI002164A37A|nr:ParB/RepB/Spo0J family partition protein [Actinokineospora sp. UTMC 2448]UVS79054.1 ParB-like nuclease domain protein [Actinokineospora sp. UTMC 2448]